MLTKIYLPWQFKKGQTPWNKGLTKLTSPIIASIARSKLGNLNSSKRIEVRAKIGLAFLGKDIGEKHHMWKGDAVGYIALHQWVARRLGKPSKCEKCNSTEQPMYHWHNKSGEYKRDMNDWTRLCASCHKIIHPFAIKY